MKLEHFESQFLDYLDGTLGEQERRELENAIESTPEVRAAFEAYRTTIAFERTIAGEQHSPHPSFTTLVMDNLDTPRLEGHRGFFARFNMYITQNKRLIFSSAATFATLIVVLRLAWQTPLETLRNDAAAPAAPIIAAPLESAPELQPTQRRSHLTAKIEGSGPIVPEAISSGSSSSNSASDAPLLERSFAMKDEVAALSAKDESRRQVTFEVDAASGVEAIVPAPQAKRSREITVSDLLSSQSAPASGATWSGELSGRINATGRPYLPSESARYVEPSNESYNSVIESAPTLVRDEPLSTFSIDVDTASYTNVRRFIQSGQLPPADAVRTEEFINYFKYQYPVQTEKPFTLSYEIAPAPLDTAKVLLKLGIKARDTLPNDRGWNLVFLIDVSGSMADSSKLPLLKRTLPILVQKMRAQDRIAIVTYAGQAGVALESTSGSEKFRIENAIQNLAAGGSTYGSGGIAAAYDLAQRHFVPGGVNRVVLATDGDFNVGLTSQHDLIRLIEEKRRSGITLTTIGVGQGNLKDGTMEQLANKGNGNNFYFDSFKEARKVFETDLVANMEVVAKDVKLQIEFNPQQVTQYRLVGYDNRKLQKQDFNNDAIDAGEIGNGHTVTALYELVLANSEAAQQLRDSLRYQATSEQEKRVVDENKRGELAFVKIRYKDPEGAASRLLEYPVLASDVRRSAEQTSDDFRFAAAVGYFATLLKQSSYRGNYSIEQVISLAEGARGKDENGYRQEFIELAKDARLLLQPRTTTAVERRYEGVR